MKKIVFVTPQFKTGGGNRVFIEIANIISNDHNVLILYPNNSSEINSFNLNSQIIIEKVGSLARGKIAKLANVFRLFWYINRNYRKDYIIISDPIISLFSFLLKAENVVRFVQADDVNIYNGGEVIKSKILLGLFKFFTKKMYRLPFTYIFNSKFTFDKFKIYSKRNVPEYIVHPAIDSNVFNVKKQPESDLLTICTIGRIHPIKGFEVFLNGIQKLSIESRKMIKEIIVISNDDLSRFNLSKDKLIDIVAPSNDFELSEIYSRSDIFISTSFSEGFGLPPLEAMACGCAVITSNSGGVVEYAIDNENCLIFKPGDDTKLSEQITRLILDKKLMLKLQQNGIRTARTSRWADAAKKFVDVLSQD